ncbi:MAG: Do family serine endopeptidase [Bacteroidales bacterium]|nr:Do family serine endopeptidase [Bacteroidales bacterium]
MKKNLLTVLISVAAAALTAFAILSLSSNKGTVGYVSGADSSSIGMPVYQTVNLSQKEYPDFTYAAESAVEAVVYVKVTVKSSRQDQMMDPFFRFFFGDEGMGSSQARQASGSGVIIREDGYIVTNNHVVENAEKVEVTLNNNKTYEATIVGTDPATDVALIKVAETGLPTVPFGNSDELRLGQWVIAIGSPYDLRSTITAGIVSAKGRQMQHSTRELKIESFIQTDAAVNPGNSGGALVNEKGELVGINTAIVSQTGSYTGYSFAIPSNLVKKVIGDIIEFGSVKRALLGITMQEIDSKKAEELKLSSPEGVYIREVMKGSAADKAGLKAGDVIVSVGSVIVKSMAEVQAQVASYRPGDKANVKVVRDGQTLDFEVTFLSSEEANATVSSDGSVSFYGATLKAADEKTLARLGLKKGVVIEDAGNGKMRQSGASDGFIILYVNDQPVSSPQDVVNIAKKAKRSVFFEGVTSSGREAYFGFGKE